jgi:cytoskeleton protein RodZ
LVESRKERQRMFEIGSSLREARERQELALPEVERATKIRSKYLAALEEERFNVLPEEVYAKAFLRTYADFLGLDGALFADEFDARMEASRPPPPPPPPEHRFALPSFDRRLRMALALAVAAMVIGLVAWRFAGGSTKEVRPVASGRSASETATTPPPNEPRRRPKLADLRLTAVGDCWLSVHIGSRDGRVLYEGMVAEGDSLHFARPRLWLRVGAPWNLAVRLNGRVVRALPEQTGNLLATRAGVRPAA